MASFLNLAQANRPGLAGMMAVANSVDEMTIEAIAARTLLVAVMTTFPLSGPA